MKTKLYILGFISLLSCGTANEPPVGILSEEEMVAILIDVQIAETRVKDLRLKSDSANEVYERYYQHLLTQHDIEDTVFYNSLHYYLNRPAVLNTIHEGILDTLNLRLQKVEAQEEKDSKEGKGDADAEEDVKKALKVKV